MLNWFTGQRFRYATTDRGDSVPFDQHFTIPPASVTMRLIASRHVADGEQSVPQTGRNAVYALGARYQ